MTEQPPPFGTWILDQALPEALANAIAKAAQKPDWPRYGGFRDVDRCINPHKSGTGIGGLEDFYAIYREQFPDA